MFNDHAETPSAIDGLTQSKHQGTIESIIDNIDAPFSLREEVIAGVMAAVKEIKLNETAESTIKRK